MTMLTTFFDDDGYELRSCKVKRKRYHMISRLASYVPASSVKAVQQARSNIDDFFRVIAPYIEWKRRQSRIGGGSEEGGPTDAQLIEAVKTAVGFNALPDTYTDGWV